MGMCCGIVEDDKKEKLLNNNDRNDKVEVTTPDRQNGNDVESNGTYKQPEKQQLVDDQKQKEEARPTDDPEEQKEEKKDEPKLPLPGQCLIDNTFDLNKDLELLKQRYGDKYAELMDRKIRKIDYANIDSDYDVDANSITVMQFNMLADALCTAYSNKKTEKTFLNVDPECLRWTYRGIRIIEEILRFNPDIIAIEECDQISFLMKYLEPKGYSHCFQIKETSPIGKIAKGLSTERGEDIKMELDGIALIYKSSKFEICGDVQQIGSDNKEKVFGLAVPLKITTFNKEILFIVTHLKSTKSQKGEELRERQINLLLKELIKNDNNLPIILCTDLNANPIQNKKGYDPLCYESIINNNNLGYSSIYKLANGSEPEYTTYKLREHGTDKHVLDYIFIKDGQWNITAILDIPKEPENVKGGLIPNWDYPSDHFSILAQLTWK